MTSLTPNEAGALLIGLIIIGFILEWITDKVEQRFDLK